MDWKALRARNIGGSESAAVLGVSPYMTKFKLWQIKKGNIEPDDLSQVDRVIAGNYFEAAILNWSSDKWGVRLVQPRVYATHPSVRGMACTPDAFSPDRDDVMAQVKNVDAMAFAKSWEAVGDVITDAPLHILLQCQHELACVPSRRENWLIACIGGNRLARMVIEPRAATQRRIERAVAEFWDSIERDEPPPMDYEADAETIMKLNSRTVEGVTLDLSDSNRLPEVIANYRLAQELESKGEAAKRAAAAEILDICGDAQKVICGDHRITLVEVRATPERVIDESMVGQKVPGSGRSGSRYPRIYSKEA